MQGRQFKLLLHKALAPIAGNRDTVDLLCERLFIQRSGVQRWCSGVHTVPEHVAAWVRELADLADQGARDDYHRTLNALPKGWQESGINERDKQRNRDKRHRAERAGADAGQ